MTVIQNCSNNNQPSLVLEVIFQPRKECWLNIVKTDKSFKLFAKKERETAPKAGQIEYL